MFSQHCYERIVWHGGAVVITLVLVATEVPQKTQLVRSLDPFGDHFEMQAVSERDDGADYTLSLHDALPIDRKSVV